MSRHHDHDPEELVHGPKLTPGPATSAPTDTIPQGYGSAAGIVRHGARAGGTFGPVVDAPQPVSTEMPLKDFQQSGLLWWINKTLLWDLGLALAVEVAPLAPGEGENSRRYVRMFVVDAIPPTRIVDFNDTNEYELLQRWLSNRAGTVRS